MMEEGQSHISLLWLSHHHVLQMKHSYSLTPQQTQRSEIESMAVPVAHKHESRAWVCSPDSFLISLAVDI